MKSVSFSLMAAAAVLCSVWCRVWGGDIGDGHLESTIHLPDDAVDRCPVVDSAQVLSDMAHPSEALPIKPEFEWAYRPVVTMRAPRGDAIPKWWKGNRPTWTNVILSWFTLFEAQDNTAQNSSVQVGSLRVFIYSKREYRWTRVDLARDPEVSLWKYPFSHVEAAGYGSVDMLNQAERKYKPAYPFFTTVGGGRRKSMRPTSARYLSQWNSGWRASIRRERMIEIVPSYWSVWEPIIIRIGSCAGRWTSRPASAMADCCWQRMHGERRLFCHGLNRRRAATRRAAVHANL